MKKHKQRAFTLVEIIMAVAIVGLIGAIIFSTFNSTVDVTDSGAEAAEQVQRERIAVKTIEDAFNSMVYYEQNRDKYTFDVYSEEASEFSDISFPTRVPPDFLGVYLSGLKISIFSSPSTKSPASFTCPVESGNCSMFSL